MIRVFLVEMEHTFFIVRMFEMQIIKLDKLSNG